MDLSFLAPEETYRTHQPCREVLIMSQSILHTPIQLKNMTLKNRVVMPPMCQYVVNDRDGKATDWHFTHYVSRAIGQTALIIVEATAVQPDGRITDYDLGLWSDEQIQPLKRIVDAVHAQGAKIAIQLGHAGRKAEDANPAMAPSAIPITYVPSKGGPERTTHPQALSLEQIHDVIAAFASAAKRAVQAGFDSIEVHAAHGYLIHEFHSVLLNHREDAYGKDRSLFGCEVIRAVKAVVPADMPILCRLSAIEYMDGGYDLKHSLAIAKKYHEAGADVFDISAGGEGMPGKNKPGNYPGYMLPLAQAFKLHFVDVPIISVGLLENPDIADYAVSSGLSDMVAVGRGMLNDPYWTLHALLQLRAPEMDIPQPYQRGIRSH